MYQLSRDFQAEDLALLSKVGEALDLLADVSHADLLLYVKSGDHALVVAQARPATVPALYPDLLVGRIVSFHESPQIHHALQSGRMAQGLKGKAIRGAPTIQEIFPICSDEGRLIAVLSSEMNLLEYERRRKKHPIYRDAISRLRQSVLTGKLEGANDLGRLGEHTASLVIDSNSRILYVSSLAEQMYRKLGYTTSLLGRRLSDLDTNEHIGFKAIERQRPYQQRIEEHNLVWVKWAIPLVEEVPASPIRRLLRRRSDNARALILIEDITEEHRKEQALRVKSALIREIHHRVKNNLQTIAALLRMQARRTGSPEVLDMLKQSINRILSIALVHEFLSKEDDPEEANQISIKEVAQRILSQVTQGILDPVKSIQLTLEGDDFQLPPQQATSCALVINELLQNAVEHGFEVKNEGTIRVQLQKDDDECRIEVIDTGQGLPPGFDMEKDGSLGLQIVQTLVREDLNGRFEMVDDGGVHALVAFPSHLTPEA
ncbi:MAG TPA: histidine kinase N-terminal domain-containing protein [Chloroflexota bacterium]|nr:histidine kinase N-terminal domain-containing protein [Chloroflexota bacterium]